MAAAHALLVLAFPLLAWSAVPTDLVTQLPGFDPPPFKMYSGYLNVPGPFEQTEYDALRIHYQFSLAQNESSSRPVVAWHQGGPGGSSVQGGFIEMGYFLVGDELKVNAHAWNQVANMLYLESPAGSGDVTGFSTCVRHSRPVTCSWNDTSQAEAYAHTLSAFYGAFPEFSKSDLYLAGESYYGQYGPNIAHWILRNAPSDSAIGRIPLAGLLVGNGCWGGDAHKVNCNGPNSDRNDVDALFGKALISPKTHKKVYSECDFAVERSARIGKKHPTKACEQALHKAHGEAGPFNVYDVYDNCPASASPRGMRETLLRARAAMFGGTNGTAEPAGGYNWMCGGTRPPGKIASFIVRPDVMKALHLKEPGQSKFEYKTSGPASVLLYPKIASRIRVLIYNGDADMCVPYNGNEEWLAQLEADGVLHESDGWKPWYMDGTKTVPGGYVTTYNVTGSEQTLTFLTIRLAGHMVPLFAPAQALAFVSRFISNEPQFV